MNHMQTHFEGTLTPQDAKHHFAHSFIVPEGATQLDIELWHAEGLDDGLSNMLTLTIFDPEGCRGAGHRMGEPLGDGQLHRVTLAASQATPGYQPGALRPGPWSVVVDAHRVTAIEPCAYRLTITTQSGAAAARTPDTAPVSRPLPSGEMGGRWYRGDLHGHTLHSDGRFTAPELVAWASQHRLDFVTLTDHNTISGLAEMDTLSSSNLLTMGGLELTTFYGHALALGLREWVDWRVNMNANAPGEPRTIQNIAADVEAKGGLFVIAHPMAVGDPVCTGCSWTYGDMMPGPARAVEVWNSGDWDNDSNNEHALALAYDWLNHGHRLVLTSGTDVHGPFAPAARLGFDVVYTDVLDERAILRAVRQGHVFLSSGPHAELTARREADAPAMMGDAIPSGTVTVAARWRDCEAGSQARLIINGAVLKTADADGAGEVTLTHEMRKGDWITLEIRQEQALIALTNPIFAR
jgi:hypothetical protein